MDNWKLVTSLETIPLQGSRVVRTEQGDIALFRNLEGEVFALHDKCPHKGGSLSQGIVFGNTVACPLHGWNINLVDGNAVAPDKGCARKIACMVQDGDVFIHL